MSDDVKALAERLNERTALKYMGDCKCGRCQLVPVDDLHAAVTALESAEAEVARLRDDQQPMNCETDTITASEDVLTWLLIEKIGCVDDRSYTPHEAQKIIARKLDELSSAEAEVARLREALPNLDPVIIWLDNGCDPKHAATELRIYKARIDALSPAMLADAR
jgi:hypothetical protein